MERSYLCIDLKSFYASVECVARGLDPMTTDLVVADPERSEKTICLAVSPSLKAKGVRNRCRVFQIPKDLPYLMAPPRMQRYIDVSAQIYRVYLEFVSKDDIHVYSIDEAFIDATPYLRLYGCTARQLADRIRARIMEQTGIPATCGLGPNLYLAKVALDITAKHSPDFTGELTPEAYREQLWDHTPLTDFWRIGPGTVRRLAGLGVSTMGQLALYGKPERLYDVFGIDAELLIDHAWGIEPVTIADIKAYRSKSHSASQGQVLPRGYAYDEARVVVREMADALAQDLLRTHRVAWGVALSVGYENADGAAPTGGSASFPARTSSRAAIVEAALDVFDRTADRQARARRMHLVATRVSDEEAGQMSLFETTDEAARRFREGERAREQAVLQVKERFGKNALLRGTDLLDCATQRERNEQIGGHKRGE